MVDTLKQMIAEVLNEAADAITSGRPAIRYRIGITLLGSEHGVSEILRGAEAAQRDLLEVEVIAIGPADVETFLTKVVVADEAAGHAKMEEMLSAGELHAAVTMHYNFPIGTSTVGLVVTPGLGKKMFIATTTGTSSTDRIDGMVRNAVYGIAAAKAYGVAQPTVGILNVDGSRQVERALGELAARGYGISFATSNRADGGAIMRGNDLLAGGPDIMVTDSLTGNLLMKMFSAYTTGGNYEALGYGYGPGVGEGFDKIIHILSRASGAPVICGAITYAANMVKGCLVEIAQQEIALAKKAGLDVVAKPQAKPAVEKSVAVPPTKPVSKQITGIDVLDLEQAQQALWEQGVYAESGMGCTGPIVLVAPDDLDRAIDILRQQHFIA